MRLSIQCGMFIMLCFNPIYSMQQARFDDFTTINQELLHKINQKEPKGWLTHAEQQSWNMLAWAYFRDHTELPLEIFTSEKDFKLHSPPLNCARFFNDRLPSAGGYCAKALGFMHLDEQDLLAIIKKYIDRGIPLMAYYIKDGHYNLAFIFGYKSANNNQQQTHILLKTTENTNLHVLTTHELQTCMDLSENIAMLHSFIPYQNYFKNKDHGGLLSDLVQQLSNFTFITFEDKEKSSHFVALRYCQIL